MEKYSYIKKKIRKMSFNKILKDFQKCNIKTKYKYLKKKYLFNL